MGKYYARDFDKCTFYKISKSTPEIKHLCCEPHYIEYKPNSLITDSGDNKLSFVKRENIIWCVTYGDQLTEIVFDSKNPLFDRIADEEIFFLPSAVGEYKSRAVITGQIYSLAEPKTIQRIIEMTHRNQLWILANLDENEKDILSIPRHLERLGFHRSLEYWRSAIEQYKSDEWRKK